MNKIFQKSDVFPGGTRYGTPLGPWHGYCIRIRGAPESLSRFTEHGSFKRLHSLVPLLFDAARLVYCGCQLARAILAFGWPSSLTSTASYSRKIGEMGFDSVCVLYSIQDQCGSGGPDSDRFREIIRGYYGTLCTNTRK